MRFVPHASVGLKIALAPAFAIVCLVIVAGMGLWANFNANQTLGQINTGNIPALGLAVDLERRLAGVHASVNQSLVWEGAGLAGTAIAALDKRTAQDVADLAKLIDSQAQNPVWSAADRTTLKQIADVYGKFKTTTLETLDIKSTGLGAAAGFITRSESSYRDINRLIDDLVRRQQESTQREVAQAEVVGRNSLVATVCGLVIAVGLTALATVMLARRLTRPMAEAVRVLEHVADRDLTSRLAIERDDEVGQMAVALNRALGVMREALDEVRRAASATATASHSVSTASAGLSSGAHEQAASLEETAASLEQITATVKQSAENAKEANQLAARSRDVAENGGQVVAEAVSAMGEINASSKRIAEIITTIDEIAFQTNLLALNAAVEAARAGEQGRGFAVVASEVRNLAQRSAAAAREIKALIQDSVGKVERGATLVNRSGQTLEEIVASFKRVTDIVAEITAASQEQSSGIDQVNRAVAQMDQVVQGNAAQTEELSSTAQALSGQADELQALVGRFKVGDEPHTAGPASSERRSAIAVRGEGSAAAVVAGRGRCSRGLRAADRRAGLVPAGVARRGRGGEPGDFEEF